MELGCELSRGLSPLGRGVIVAAGPVASDRAVSRGAELSTRLSQAVRAALGGDARALPGAPTPAQARAAAGRAEVLVVVAPEIVGGEIRAVADAYPMARSFWDRVRALSPGPVAHAFASRRLDAEVASFLPTVPLVANRTDRAAIPTSDVVALGCGDVDGDGALDIVLVGRHKIAIGRVRGGKFVSTRETSWPELSSVAPSPLREPLAEVTIGTGRYVDVGLTDRESGFRLSPQLSKVARLDAPIPWARAGCLSRAGTALGATRPCARDAERVVDVHDVTGTDAVAGASVVGRDGRARAIVAFRSPRDGTGELRDDAGLMARTPALGATLAIGDVDLDGDPDLLASVNTLSSADDALVVSSWTRDGSVHEKLRLPVPEGVRAVAACPAEGGTMSPIVVATTSSLWVVR